MAIDTTNVRSRRSLLTAALAGMAGAAAATVAGAQRVLAAGNDGTPIEVAGHYEDARNATWIINNANNETALNVANNQAGNGLEAGSYSGVAIAGTSVTGEGVYGFSHFGTGVHGVAGTAQGAAQNYPAAVLGEARLPHGVSMLGNNYATSGTAEGVQGTTDSPGGYATVGWARKQGTALVGASGPDFPPTSRVPKKTGVYGYAEHGRGGVFEGPVAQLRLIPSTAATHPASGAAGDFFLDKSKRLWLCLGASAWKRVQLV